MQKAATVAGLMILALLIGLSGAGLRLNKAEADPTAVVIFNPDVCAAKVIDIMLASGSSASAAFTEGLSICTDPAENSGALYNTSQLAALAAHLGGDVDDPATYAELEAASITNNDISSPWGQLGVGSSGSAGEVGDQSMWVLAFVDNRNSNVQFQASEGVWWHSTHGGDQDCPEMDDDCIAGGFFEDGVVPALLSGDGAATIGYGLGIITQSGTHHYFDYYVVGPPDAIDFNPGITVATTWIQEGAETSDCDLSNFDAVVGLPQVSGLQVEVTDAGGSQLIGIWTDWASNLPGVADLARIQTGPDVGEVVGWAVTQHYGNNTIGRNLACGVTPQWAHIDIQVASDASVEIGTDIHVTGLPVHLTLSTDHSTLVCDGLDASIVSAYVTDDYSGEGGPYPVADGTVVHFDVSDPGSVDPPDATTVDGVATAIVGGVSGVTTDLNVTATSGDASDSLDDLSCVDAMPPGDLNCSGTVSMVDAMLIAQKVAGLITDFPCPH